MTKGAAIEGSGALRDRLGKTLGADVDRRVLTLTLRDGAATLVLDAEGLDARGRAGAEKAVREALAGQDSVSEVRVAFTAQKDEQAAARESNRPPIIAVGSGKGGVGKSTVSANLAVALGRAGVKAGLVDADISGPSQARLLGTEDVRPKAHDKRLVPVASRHGVPVLSMAHLAEPGVPIAWRGPKIAGALTQLLEAHWDDADVLVVDLPPGTGDVQLTMLQSFRPAGAVIVSTPQDLALMDAERAISLFSTAKVPLLGVVENMAGYACPHCGEVSDPFGAGGAEAAAGRLGIPFLGRIPLDIAIRRASDAGDPPAAGDAAGAAVFAQLARQVAAAIGLPAGTEG